MFQRIAFYNIQKKNDEEAYSEHLYSYSNRISEDQLVAIYLVGKLLSIFNQKMK